MEESPTEHSTVEQLLEHVQNLEKRISKIETHLQIEEPVESLSLESTEEIIKEEKELLEFRIGEFWFAKVGIVILAVAIIFSLTLPYNNFSPVIPSLIGYLIVGLIFGISHYLKKSFEFVSRYLFGGGLLLLYFSTYRLHFFSPVPAISSISIELAVLLIVVCVNLFISLRRNSVYLTALNVTLGYITAIASGNAYFLFAIVTLLSVFTVFLKIKYGWNNLLILGIILTYLTHFIWAINNPFLGNKIQLVQEPHFNVIFLLIYCLIFVYGNFSKPKNSTEFSAVTTNSILNAIGCYSLFLLITLGTFESYLTLANLMASSVFLVLSFLFWSKQENKYSTFIYAIMGYTALSVAIINQFPEPDSLIVLSWQSLLVISTAIWFRSKIIILTNFIMFLTIFIAFLSLAEEVSFISFTFGIVALISARLLNWKKDQLELQTEIMRNAYLTVAFFIIPYSLYHSLPESYLIFSWVVITIIYYILSIFLKNKKYRWMAHLTLMATVIYSVIIGTSQEDPTYRIITFFIVGIVLVFVSLMYTKLKSKLISEKSESD